MATVLVRCQRFAFSPALASLALIAGFLSRRAMRSFFTRRQTLAFGISALASRSGSAEEITTKRQFMQESLENVRKNGQKFERSSKMRFGAIPRVIPFVDWDYYFLDGLLLWMPNPGQTFEPVTVPKGFVTDLASVPEMLWSVFPKTGRYAYAAIVHDYLYWFQTRPKDEADQVLIAAMEDAAVPAATRVSFSIALKAAGSLAWHNNTKAREAGEFRILAKFPDNPLISWDDWRKRPDVFKTD